MPIEVPAVPNPASAAPATALTSGSPTGTGNNPDDVKAALAAIEEAKAEIKSLKEHTQKQSQLIAGLQKKPKEDNTQEDPLSERVKVLEEKDAKQLARDKAQKDREALAQVKAALVANGVPAEKAERSAKMVIVEHGNKVAVDEVDNSLVVTIKDGEKQVAVSAWVSAYMQTNEGKFYLPPVLNPSSAGLAPSSGAPGKPQLTSEQIRLGKFDFAKLRAGGYEIVE